MRKKLWLVMILILIFITGNLGYSQTWSANKRLTFSATSSTWPAIAVSSNNHVHVVWSDTKDGDEEIYYKKSTNGGNSWLAIKRITWNQGESTEPAIAVGSNNNPCIVWNDDTPGNDEVFYRRSSNGGTSWQAVKRITWTSTGSFAPDIFVDSSNNPHLVWHDPLHGNREIFYKKSTDGGFNFGVTKRITWTMGSSRAPSIAVDSSKDPHISWYEQTMTDYEIGYKRSTDGGNTWGSLTRLTYSSGDSRYPQLAVDTTGNPHALWNDDSTGNKEIYYKKSTNGGTNWGITKRISWATRDSEDQALAVDSNNNPYIIWADQGSGPFEIYFRESTNGGGSWSALKRITWNLVTSLDPDIAIGPSNSVHIVWRDSSFGPMEIFYKNRK